MNKSFIYKTAVTLSAILILIIFFAGCESTPSAHKGTYQVCIHDDCPKTTSALKAEMWIKLSDSDYDGTTQAYISPKPAVQDVWSVSKGIDYCYIIRDTIKEESKKDCQLIFNTRQDQSGISLDFSTADKALESLRAMTEAQEHDIYAVYIY